MFELLFLVALVAWLFFSALEFVLSLPCAPAFIAAFVAVPPLAAIRYASMVRVHRLSRVRPGSRPVPPEKFFWPLSRRRIGLRLAAASGCALFLWPVAVVWPARASLEVLSLAGWVSSLFAVLSLAEALAAGCLYVHASHWFDRHAPNFVGWTRRLLYLLSDNHEFLGEDPLPRERRRREKVF